MPYVALQHYAGFYDYLDDTKSAYLTVCYNHRFHRNEYLLVVFGPTVAGGTGELAHLPLPQEAFDALARYYPVMTALGLNQSAPFPPEYVLSELAAHWPLPDPVAPAPL